MIEKGPVVEIREYRRMYLLIFFSFYFIFKELSYNLFFQLVKYIA